MEQGLDKDIRKLYSIIDKSDSSFSYKYKIHNNTVNLTLTVLEPLSIPEQSKSFWDIYGQLINIIAGGFVGEMASFVFDRYKKKN